MSNFTLSDSFLLRVFSNKNSRLFEDAGQQVLKEFSGNKEQVGIIYNDYNADPKMIDAWQKETKDEIMLKHMLYAIIYFIYTKL